MKIFVDTGFFSASAPSTFGDALYWKKKKYMYLCSFLSVIQSGYKILIKTIGLFIIYNQ